MKNNQFKSYEDYRKLVINEIDKALSTLDEDTINMLIDEILSAEKVFFVGVGRVMLSLKSIIKRLNHLGIKAHYVGEISEPALTDKDLLIVGSGSGSTLFPLAIANKAHSVGSRIIHIGSNPKSELANIVNLMVRIPVQTKYYLDDEIKSEQPMTSLFEQSLLVLGDIIALMIINRKQLDLKALWKFHANME